MRESLRARHHLRVALVLVPLGPQQCIGFILMVAGLRSARATSVAKWLIVITSHS